MLKLSAYPITHHRTANLASDHEASSRSGKRAVRMLGNAGLDVKIGKREMDDEPRPSRPPTRPHGGGEVGALAQPGRGRKHGNSRFRATSGRKALTALPTASGEDGTTGASAHAQPKAVGLCAPAVVRLERALAHSRAPRKGPVRPGVKSVRAAGQKELLRYGATADTVKPAPPRQEAGPTQFTTHSSQWTQASEVSRANCGERLEAQGDTLLASHGPDLIEVNRRSSDMMQSSERTPWC